MSGGTAVEEKVEATASTDDEGFDKGWDAPEIDDPAPSATASPAKDPPPAPAKEPDSGDTDPGNGEGKSTEANAEPEKTGDAEADAGGEPKASDTTGSEPEGSTGSDPASEGSTGADPLDELKGQFTEFKEASVKERNDLKSEVGRLRRQISDAAQAPPALKASDKQPEVTAAEDKALISETLKPLKEADPELAGPVEKLMTGMAERIAKQDERFSDLEGKVTKVESSTADEQFTETVRETHADVDQIRADKNFHDWLGTQPVYVQNASGIHGNELASHDPADATSIISSYKETLETKDPDADPSPTPGSEPKGADPEVDQEKATREARLKSTGTAGERSSNSAMQGKQGTAKDAYDKGWDSEDEDDWMAERTAKMHS